MQFRQQVGPPPQHLVEQRRGADDARQAAGLRRLQAQQPDDIGAVGVIGQPRRGLVAAMRRPGHSPRRYPSHGQGYGPSRSATPARRASCQGRNRRWRIAGHVQRSTGMPRTRMKPAACSTALRICWTSGSRAGTCRSVGPMAAMSMPVASSRCTAASSAAISVAESGRIQSVRRAISGPYQTAGPEIGRNSGPMAAAFIGCLPSLRRRPGPPPYGTVTATLAWRREGAASPAEQEGVSRP